MNLFWKLCFAECSNSFKLMAIGLNLSEMYLFHFLMEYKLIHRYLAALKEAGLGSLPGTAAEVLHDGVRAQLCPDKLSSGEWLEVLNDGLIVPYRGSGPPPSAIIWFYCILL